MAALGRRTMTKDKDSDSDSDRVTVAVTVTTTATATIGKLLTDLISGYGQQGLSVRSHRLAARDVNGFHRGHIGGALEVVLFEGSRARSCEDGKPDGMCWCVGR